MNKNKGTVRGPGPTGLLRLLLRCPILCYRLHLGWVLGRRFLLLTHIGRKSGLPRQTVLEVVNYDSTRHRCIIASGWGEKAQWFRNIILNPDVEVILGTYTHHAKARRMDRDEAERELRDYAHRHPWSMKKLNKSMLGKPFQGQDEDFRQLAAQVPLVELKFKDPSRASFTA